MQGIQGSTVGLYVPRQHGEHQVFYGDVPSIIHDYFNDGVPAAFISASSPISFMALSFSRPSLISVASLYLRLSGLSSTICVSSQTQKMLSINNL